jgi:hypothetical protein
MDLFRTHDSKALNYVTMLFSSLGNLLSMAYFLLFQIQQLSLSDVHLVFEVTNEQAYMVYTFDICITHLMSMKQMVLLTHEHMSADLPCTVRSSGFHRELFLSVRCNSYKYIFIRFIYILNPSMLSKNVKIKYTKL